MVAAIAIFEEIEIRPEPGTVILNTLSGETGIVRAIWLNQWSGQEVVNVRSNGTMKSWNIANVEVL
jgi:hypothetical protein